MEGVVVFLFAVGDVFKVGELGIARDLGLLESWGGRRLRPTEEGREWNADRRREMGKEKNIAGEWSRKRLTAYKGRTVRGKKKQSSSYLHHYYTRGAGKRMLE